MLISLEQKNIFSKKEFLEFEKFCEKFKSKNFAKFKKNPPKFCEILRDENLQKIKKFKSENFKNSDFEKIVICGIGGSALGARAIRDALEIENLEICDSIDSLFLKKFLRKNFAEKKSFFVIPDSIRNLGHFLISKFKIKNCRYLPAGRHGFRINFFKIFRNDKSENFIEKISAQKLQKTLFFIISKSGKTVETISQFYFLRKIFAQKNLEISQNFVFIYEKNSPLFQISQKLKIPFFEISPNLSGRFSVFSAVGFLPLHFCGAQISEIFAGAKNLKNKIFDLNFTENVALKKAATLFLKRKKVAVDFIYARNFLAAGNFYRQLLAESCGKNGNEFLSHISAGTRDQHSDLQLFCDGEKNKIFTFWTVENFGENLNLPKIKNADFEFLSEKNFTEILNANFRGVEKSLREKNLPTQILKIPKISPQILGEILFLFEAEIFFLAKMLNLNAFDQPGVERGKVLARDFLEK